MALAGCIRRISVSRRLRQEQLRNQVPAVRLLVHRSRSLASAAVDQSRFLCPMSHAVMKDPVTASDGITYERSEIEGWLKAGHRTSPVTGKPLGEFLLLTA